jgi:hypothetical protein
MTPSNHCGARAGSRNGLSESQQDQATGCNRELTGGVSFEELAARSVSRQTGQGSGLGLGWSVL